MSYDSTQDTTDHIEKVAKYIHEIRDELFDRAFFHDQSKFNPPEKAIFDEFTPKLRELEYNSEEYKRALADMGVALEHHYEVNDHHPEHFEHGIEDMNLLQLIEMLADWKAASERVANGDFAKSLEINRKRFKIPDGLYETLERTAKYLGWV